jgi:hypothetical protein
VSLLCNDGRLVNKAEGMGAYDFLLSRCLDVRFACAVRGLTLGDFRT